MAWCSHKTLDSVFILFVQNTTQHTSIVFRIFTGLDVHKTVVVHKVLIFVHTKHYTHFSIVRQKCFARITNICPKWAIDFLPNESDQIIQKPGFSFVSSISLCPVWPRRKIHFQNYLPVSPQVSSRHLQLHVDANMDRYVAQAVLCWHVI